MEVERIESHRIKAAQRMRSSAKLDLFDKSGKHIEVNITGNRMHR